MAEEIKRKRQQRKKVETDFQPLEETIQDSNQEIQEAKPEIKPKTKIEKADLPKPSEIPKIPTRMHGTFLVRIKGQERHLTAAAIKVAEKDPSLRLEIPEGTDFELQKTKECKDC